MLVEFEYKKSLGQNFIYNLEFLRSIVSQLNIKKEDIIIEIGTGAGTLTKVLAETGAKIVTIEIDERLKPILEKQFISLNNVTLIFGDAMKESFMKYGKYKVIANVPYYITTPLIMKFLDDDNCTIINILIAREVANRIVASTCTHEYGSLSVACQLQSKCQIIKNVGKEMFTPEPKVDSAFVSIVKNENKLDTKFKNLLKGIFASRRKTIVNALSNALSLHKETVQNILEKCGIDFSLRPEQLPPTKFWEISQNLTNLYK